MEPVFASLALIEQGRRLLMLERLPQLQVACPVRILHGVQVCGSPQLLSIDAVGTGLHQP
jgi:hypothetical protein